jgi:two-component system chemotaxis response regulator CheY
VFGKPDAPILVVEDDPSLRDLLDWGLSDMGYRVATAEDGQAALNSVKRDPPCIIFLDMRMPVLDGWGFARCYRNVPGPHAPIVVITAARDAQEWARQVDAVDFLPKPFDLDEVLEKVHRYVG